MLNLLLVTYLLISVPVVSSTGLRWSWSRTSRTVLTRQWSTTSDALKDDSVNLFRYFNRRIRRSTSCEPCADSSPPKLNLLRKLWKVYISFHSEICTCVSDLSVVVTRLAVAGPHIRQLAVHSWTAFTESVYLTQSKLFGYNKLWFDCSWLLMRVRHRLSSVRSWRWCSCSAELMKHYYTASMTV